MATKSNEENDGGGAGRGAERFRPTSLFELVREPLRRDEARPRREPPTESFEIDLKRVGYNLISKYFEVSAWHQLFEMLKNALLDAIYGKNIPRHAFQDATFREDILILLCTFDNFFKNGRVNKKSNAWKVFFKGYMPFFLVRVLNVCDEQLARTIPHLFQFLAGYCALVCGMPACIGERNLRVYKIEERFTDDRNASECNYIFLGVGAHLMSRAQNTYYALVNAVMETLFRALLAVKMDILYSRGAPTNDEGSDNQAAARSTSNSRGGPTNDEGGDNQAAARSTSNLRGGPTNDEGGDNQAAARSTTTTASQRRLTTAPAEEQIEFVITTSKSAVRSVAEMAYDEGAAKRRFVKIYQVDDKYDAVKRCIELHMWTSLRCKTAPHFKAKWEWACWPQRAMEYIENFVSKSHNARRRFEEMWTELLPTPDVFSRAVSSICRGVLPVCCTDMVRDASYERRDLWYANGDRLKKVSCVMAFGITRGRPARVMNVDFVNSSLLNGKYMPPNNPYHSKCRRAQTQQMNRTSASSNTTANMRTTGSSIASNRPRGDQHRSHCGGRDSPTHDDISRPSAGDTSPNPGTLAVKRERSGRTPPSDNPKRSRTTRNVAAASCVSVESESTPHAS